VGWVLRGLGAGERVGTGVGETERYFGLFMLKSSSSPSSSLSSRLNVHLQNRPAEMRNAVYLNNISNIQWVGD